MALVEGARLRAEGSRSTTIQNIRPSPGGTATSAGIRGTIFPGRRHAGVGLGGIHGHVRRSVPGCRRRPGPRGDRNPERINRTSRSSMVATANPTLGYYRLTLGMIELPQEE